MLPKLNSAHGSETRNIINRAIEVLNEQGKTIQDLVAEGQLSPEQYGQLISIVNGNVSKGSITADDLDKNNFQLDQTHLSDELKQQITGNAPINAVPADESLTTEKYANSSVTLEKTKGSDMDLSKLTWKLEEISGVSGLPKPDTRYLTSNLFLIGKGARFFRLEEDINCYVQVYDENYNYLGRYAGTVHNEVPIDCYYARISLFYRDLRDISEVYSTLIPKYEIHNHKFNNPIELVKDESVYQLDKWQKGTVSTTNGGFQKSETRFVSDYIKGSSGVSIEMINPSTQHYVVLYDYEFNFIKALGYTNSRKIDDDFYVMRIVVRYSDDRVVTDLEKTELVEGLNYYNYTSLPNWAAPFAVSDNPLSGKTLLNFGDSIASAQTEGVEGYHHIIANKNKMNLVNYARGGATIRVVDGATNNIKTQIESAVSSGVQPEYILFDGLRNDVSHAENTIGTITEGYSETLDTSTFCGAFEYYCKTLRQTWLGAKIIYIRTHNTSAVGARQIQLGELALDMCKKWAIPFVDVYSGGGLNTQIAEMRGVYTISEVDGSHPNTAGYENFYVPPIEAKMKSV